MSKTTTTSQRGGRRLATPTKEANDNRRAWWRKLRRRDFLIFFCPVVLALLVILIAAYLDGQAIRYTLTDTGIRYYAGSRYYMEEGTVLRRTDEEQTVMELSSGDYTIDSLPIYYQSSDGVVLAENMVYYEPRSGIVERMDYFTNVTIEESGAVYAYRDDEKVFLTGGFAYDGGDIYVFFESVILEFNGYRMELPPLSYIEAVFTRDVTVYHSGAGEQYIEAPEGDVTITFSGAPLELSLLEDAMHYDEGGSQLMFTRPDLLESIFQ